MSHRWRVRGRRRAWVGYMAIGIAAVVGAGPASSAQDRVPGHGKSAATGTDVKERQTHQGPGNNTGISLVVPTGRVSVGPESLDGEDIHVRRRTAREGMAIVEVSATPFMPDLPPSEDPRGARQSIVRPDQPASW